jgi:excisionase family DNA binding protein
MSDMLSLSQAAARLGISVRTGRRWIQVGALPAELHHGRYGPQYKVAEEAVLALLAEHGQPLPRDEAKDSLRHGAPAPSEIEQTWQEVTRLQQELGRACQELAWAREELQGLREELTTRLATGRGQRPTGNLVARRTRQA